MALIELDLTARPEPTPPPPVRHYRLPGLLLVAVLAVALGGAAPVASRLWRELGGVPVQVEVADGRSYQLSGGRIFTFQAAGTDRLVTAWEPGETPRRRWTARLPVRVAEPDEVTFGGTAAQVAGDVVLVFDGAVVTVLDLRDGRVRWRSSGPLTLLGDGRTAVVEETVFRPGTLYDQDSGEPGRLYFSSTGEPHTQPPVRTEVRAADLGTGRVRWSARAAGAVNVLAAPGGAPDVLMITADRLERRAGGTGTVQRRVALPSAGRARPIGGELIDGRLVVAHGRESVEEEVGYAPDTLAELWSRPLTLDTFQPPVCFDVLCDGSRTAVDVRDPDTGRPLWRVSGEAVLSRRAGYVLETGGGAVPRRLADPRTGATKVSLTGWLTDDDGRASDQPVLLRRAQAAGASAFAVVTAGRAALQPLGLAYGPLSDCTADDRYVVCREADRLRIWAYRA